MTRLTLTKSAVALVLGASTALAQAPADEHAGHHPSDVTQPATAPAARTPTQQAEGPAATQVPQDSMTKMQELMMRIHASKDSAERLKLMKQHSLAMTEQMGMMRGMRSGQDGMMDRRAMQARMNMMQMMMDQMQQHLDALPESQSGEHDH